MNKEGDAKRQENGSDSMQFEGGHEENSEMLCKVREDSRTRGERCGKETGKFNAVKKRQLHTLHTQLCLLYLYVEKLK